VAAVQPFERLRAIARRGGDDRLLLAEAADCLGEFDDDPAALVVTCRRLLHHHPDRTPLWWLCSRVLAAAEPSEAAWDAEALMRADPTADRLAGLLPFPADDPVAVFGWPEVAGGALALRPDLEVLVVRGAQPLDRWRPALAGSGVQARPVDAMEAAACAPSHLLVEVAGAGPGQVLVAAGSDEVIATVMHPGLAVWLVAGVGRVLPDRLFAAMLAAIGSPEQHGLELLDLEVVDRIAGPTGVIRPEHLGRRVDGPIAPELLRGT
jgi:hypothetical protein